MIYTKLTKKALIMAYEKHFNQYDKSGMPYIFHPYHLAEQMDDEASTVVALLHDTLEDTDTTFEEILNEFGEDIADTIKLLTKPKDLDYFEYVKNLKRNSTAVKVKLADLNHNKDLSRLDKVTDEDIIRVKKYEQAINILKN